MKRAAGAKVFLDRGGKLTLLNQDIDMHKLVRLAGPRAALGGYVMMSHQKTVMFTKAGTYKLRTRTNEMEGMVDVKTKGPDNPLPVYVVVK
jgi:uncharacterized cupredoxin-like copper-binding protein